MHMCVAYLQPPPRRSPRAWQGHSEPLSAAPGLSVYLLPMIITVSTCPPSRTSTWNAEDCTSILAYSGMPTTVPTALNTQPQEQDLHLWNSINSTLEYCGMFWALGAGVPSVGHFFLFSPRNQYVLKVTADTQMHILQGNKVQQRAALRKI